MMMMARLETVKIQLTRELDRVLYLYLLLSTRKTDFQTQQKVARRYHASCDGTDGPWM